MVRGRLPLLPSGRRRLETSQPLSSVAFQRNRRFIHLSPVVRPRHLVLGPERRKPFNHRPELRLDYPLNLSILVSGGIETEQDPLSNGERTGVRPH